MVDLDERKNFQAVHSGASIATAYTPQHHSTLRPCGRTVVGAHKVLRGCRGSRDKHRLDVRVLVFMLYNNTVLQTL